jgi:Tol biopolymer transport system component
VLVEKTNDFGFPRPSPDGRWLLIERDPENKLLRVPMTGGQEELIAKDVYGTPSCAAPTTGLCAYSKLEKNQLTFMGFDPQLKQRTGLGSFTLDPDFKGSYFWTLSPDATEIAILETGTGNIYLLNVKTKALQRIIVKHWSNLVNMDWTADGKGLFMCGLRNGSVLLRVDLHGNAEVLWEAGGVSELWALPSPDGKHVAMSFFSANANVWMMENF